jgi:hypothetical protein
MFTFRARKDKESQMGAGLPSSSSGSYPRLQQRRRQPFLLQLHSQNEKYKPAGGGHTVTPASY